MVTPPDVEPPQPVEDDDDHDEAMPRALLTRRSILAFTLFVVFAAAFLYFVLPQIAGLDETWNRIDDGDPLWLAAAFVFTVLSFGGYVVLFQAVFVGSRSRIDLAASYQITMAGLAATRLLAAGGAGGIALTAWALRRSGMPRRTVADKSVAFLVLTYAVYMGALVIVGYGLYLGVLPGDGSFAITVLPATLALVAIALALLLSRVPPDLQRRLEGFARRGGRLARVAQLAANAPASFSAGIREAICHVARRDPALLGALAFWGFNIAVLWACFNAFGHAPEWPIIVMAYFVGFLGNLLPLPGGIGGVDGGMIAAFVAFGVDSSLAIVAVLTYRAFAFWLPTIPGAIAYLQLRRTVARWREDRRRSGEIPAPAGA